MVKAMFLVPVADNDGKRFTRTDWRELEQRLLQFGGYSRSSGVHGAWTSKEGRTYRDTCRRFEVALPGWSRVPALLDLVRWVRVRFRQEAIYLEIAGIPDYVED